jgi:hypothetical protein
MSDDEDPPVDEALARALADGLSASSARAADLVREHIADYGEVLPHILAADVARWFCRAGLHPALDESADADAAVAVLSSLFSSGDDDLQDVVSTGFLEVLPHPGEAGREVVERLPSPLRDELRRMEEWSPG